MLSLIRGHIRKQPQYVLGLHGLCDSKVANCHEESIPTVWETFQSQLEQSIETEWQLQATRVDAVRIANTEGNSDTSLQRSRKERYDQMRFVGDWKQNRLSLVNLGINDVEVVSQFGRHCDGVLFVMAASRSAGTKWLHQLRMQNIPWLGYWNMEVQSRSLLQKVG